MDERIGPRLKGVKAASGFSLGPVTPGEEKLAATFLERPYRSQDHGFRRLTESPRLKRRFRSEWGLEIPFFQPEETH